MQKNKFVLAAAGAGKTTYLVKEALMQKSNVLILTYTEANEAEIRRKFIELNGYIPQNITVKTWFSTLLQHGVRPFQGCVIEKKISGMHLVNSQSAVKYVTKSGIPVCYKEEDDLEKYYFTDTMKIYSDKLSKLVYKCNQKSGGAVIDRLSRIFPNIYIDEVQDLAGYDLELLKLLFKSTSKVILVGDPRQVTYLTHNERKYEKYADGRIKEFIQNECNGSNCVIDDSTLNCSFRNNECICQFSSRLYPDFDACVSNQRQTTCHDGIFLVRKADVDKYLSLYNPIQLRDNIRVPINKDYKAINFGESKGLTYDRVLIYPTKPIIEWLEKGTELKPFSRSRFYVAITRAKYSVGIVYDYSSSTTIQGTQNFI